MKKVIPWLLIPISAALGATTVKLFQLRAPTSQSPSLLYSTPGGAIGQGKINGMQIDGSGNITLPSTNIVPSLTVTHVSATTQNNFPIPTGRSLCFVSLNIPQALMEDYTIVNNSIVFNNPPQVDDIVQLLCF